MSAVTRLRNPAALKAIRIAVAARVRELGADSAAQLRANGVALRELDAGRSTGVAMALALGAVTGRRNALLQGGGQVPA